MRGCDPKTTAFCVHKNNVTFITPWKPRSNQSKCSCDGYYQLFAVQLWAQAELHLEPIIWASKVSTLDFSQLQKKTLHIWRCTSCRRRWPLISMMNVGETVGWLPPPLLDRGRNKLTWIFKIECSASLKIMVRRLTSPWRFVSMELWSKAFVLSTMNAHAHCTLTLNEWCWCLLASPSLRITRSDFLLPSGSGLKQLWPWIWI